ncbi:MAG: SDR family NAD(P)-dependent oxidoreductase, partial [Verrucomicrobia bacterium]|nr:SDR family NAD(P)-dependent oxidoreductase [Verrucomicrobiota bacterium]
ILDQVQARRLSKEEALARIKSLHATPGSEEERAAVHYFREVWQESPIRGATSDGKAKAGGAVLVLDSSPEIAEALREGAQAGSVIWARPAAKFERIGAQDYLFRVGQKEDVDRLFGSLAEAGVLPARIVQVGSRAVPGQGNFALAEQFELGAELALLVFQAAVRFKGKEPIHQVYLHFGAADEPSPAAGAVVGLFKELGLERPNFTGKVCHCESMDAKGIAQTLVGAVWPDSDFSVELSLAAADGRVWCKVAERVELSAPGRPVLREYGVCLITGGAGGLGYLFAEHLARRSRARLVLIGRSEPSEKIRDRLRTLDRLGAEARYFQADVGQLAELEAAVSEARAVFGPINAVIHAAGVMPYGRSTDIGLAALRAVWKAKIQGTLNLDATTREEPLDWMALFSSIASVIGVAEACGYASGNAFLDHFAAWRAGEVRAGRRVGRTIAFNWPLWEEGGMQVQGQAAGAWRDWMWSSQGMQPLTTSAGVTAFEAGILSEESRIIVAQGDADRIVRTLRRGLGWRPETRSAETNVAVKRATVAVTRNGDGRESLRTILKGMVGELLSVPEDAIDVKAGLGEFGFDSISLKSFAERLNERFKLDLMPSVFFNHASLGALADYLRAAHPEATGLPGENGRDDSSTTKTSALLFEAPTPSHEEPIAIVGLSGLLPGSPSLEAFWSHLLAGRDLISEVPASRWDAAAAYQAGEAGEGKSNSKWGGFIDDVEGFDARFFGVPPWEADRMDPQHRLFLETAWNCLESAGEAPADLAGRRVGVFVGIQFHEYQDLLALAGDLHMYNATGNGHAMIANRLSYFLDLRGPSEAVDTACSSSLVALNRAVSAIRAGECESAIVGGASLILSPGTLVVTSQMGILSPDGRCKVFDAAANGYVKGEGILAAYLMPLSKAQRGGYPVWGLVRGIGVNHGGRASSLTAPNSQAQRDLVSGVFRLAGVDPETVGYIEAHGTGTELGDPVEVEGLKSAFSVLSGQSTWARPFCGLGSVKSNIGHLEPAAGLAGVAKVLLAMRHKTLPATLHLKTPNPYLKLEGSPFFLVAESRPWDSPRDKSGQPGPRRAGVSSFGFGGANAHVVLEEYQPVSTATGEEPATSDSVFVVSAKSEAAVSRRLADLSGWLASGGLKASRQDLARTLQSGRSHFDYRCAVVASSLAELGEVLQVLLRGGTDPRASSGKAGTSGARLTQPGSATAAELAEAFVRGDAIAWSEMGAGRLFRRLALPGYPFEKTKHWFHRAGGVSVPAGVQTAAPAVSAPAPMKLKALSGSRGGTAPGATSTSHEPGSSGRESAQTRSGANLSRLTSAATGPSPVHRLDAGLALDVTTFHEPSPSKSPAEGAGESDRGVKVQTRMPSRSDVARAVSSIVATALYLDESTLDQTKSFVDLGCDSILGVEIIRRINTAFGINLPASKLYEHPNVAALSTYVAGLGAGPAAVTGAVVPAPPVEPTVRPADRGGSRVVVVRSGDIDDLIYTAADPSAPGEREIQVEVVAASVILPDLLCVRGLYPTMPPYPFTPGFEFAGVVRAAGRKASLHKVGDRVFGVTGDTLGAHALRLNVREELAAKVPPGLSLIEAATVPEAFLTAYFALIELGRLAEGERLLIGSAASGTGLAAVQLAQWRKAEILSMVGSDEKVEYLRGLGISDVVNYREGDLAAFCARVVGPRGVDVVLNMLTGEPREAALRCLAPFGRFLDLAVAGLRADGRTDLSSMVSNQVYFSVDCRRLSGGGAEKIQRILGLLADLLAAGTIQPLKVNRLFDFSEAKRAYALVRDRVGIGKTLLYRRDSATAASDEGPRDVSVRRLPSAARAGSFPEVAVIGMAGRFPGAEDLEQFWELLCQGRCAVREVPASRWAAEQYFDPDPGAPGKTYSKWGGFLEGIDQFDPLFFSLSPAEAEQMDPQQRLFLETAWHAMEDAGYAAEGSSGARCGVFVGVGQGDYVEAVRKAGGELSASLLMGSSCSMIGARLAYFMNLTGPAVALDTACSSSLLAIYNACQSLAAGDSDLALAGGVCVMTTPAMYVMMSKARMLSPTGLCRTFDQGADGFVPGEGVGVIVLKLLDRALRDGDHIYGVIKGGGSNQDGATNGITAPNPASQKALEIEAYRRSGVDPASIGYVEAHGTGTKLGDPVEMDAITEAFSGFTQRRGYCAVGSVKTNIGHTLSAAGVASAIKTLLCLHHQKLVPSLHYRQPNEHIAFEASPFYVNTELRDWPRPDHAPRRAAVSSFGFSGTNVHLVFEAAPECAIHGGGPKKPAYLLTLSARTDEGLRERMEQLSTWLAAGGGDVSLEAVAYTLNAGRMHFRKRCFVVADSIASLRAGLGEVRFGKAARLAGPALAEGSRRSGEIIGDLAFALSNPDRYTAILHELGGFYVQGVLLDWACLHTGEANRRISLPGYPFRRKRYWASGPTIESQTTSSPAVARHPLLDASGSGSAGAPFTRRVRPSDWFVRDHEVRGVKTVPGVVYLEMARAAAAARFGRGVSAIRRFVIRQPVHVQSDDVKVEVRLAPTEGGAEFAIHTLGQGGSICHAQGVLELGEPRVVPERVSIHELEQAVHAPADKPAIYEYFQVAGLEYGAAFQALSRLGLDSSGEIGIARVDLPSVARADAAAYYLHPALLDGAWQSIAGWSLAGQENTPFALPFEVEEILLFGPLTEAGYVRTRRGEASGSGEIHRYDVQFFDPAGAERCRVTGLTMKSVGPGRNPGGIQLFHPVWVPREVSVKPGWTLGRLLVLDDNESRFAAVRAQCPEAVQVRRGDAFDCRSPEVFVVRPESTEDFAQLLAATYPGERVEAAVLCMWDLDAEAGSTEPESASLLSSIALTRALIERGFSRLRLVQAGRSWQAGLMSSWAKSLMQEHPGFRCVTVEVDVDGSPELPARLLKEFDGDLVDPEIRLVSAGRLAMLYERATAAVRFPYAFRENGVYLVTGGLGGLGRLVAEHLARSVGARVALLGRSALTADAQRWVDSLGTLGGEGAYWQADVTRLDEVRRVVDGVKERFEALHGVFHAAGVLRDSRLVNKTADDVRAVLAPKIRGAINLDLATRDLDLDFLVFFSSVAGALGSAGQCDYAAANGFLDRFAEEREAQRAAGRLTARTISINWPWWKEGGMRPAQATIDWLRTTWGLAGLETEVGLRLLEEILRSDMTRVLVLCGDEHRWTEIAKRKAAVVPSPPVEEAGGAGSAWLRQQIIRLMAEQLKVEAAEIDQHEDFSLYGFDSISLTEFSNRLNRVHQLETTPALFFEYTTVALLADHLVGAYPGRFGIAVASAPASPPPTPGTLERTAEAPHASGPAVAEEQNRWIAVIAMEGR